MKELPTIEPTFEPTVEPTFEPTVEPTVVPTVEPIVLSTEEFRAVYDSDVSDSILAKLSAYYNEYGQGQDYAIYRFDQYNYYLVIGDYSNGTFSNARIIRYQTSTGYGTSGAYVTITSSNSYTPDLSVYTGYVYSSVEGYLPSRYVDSSLSTNTKLFSITMAICCCLITLLLIIGIWTKKIRKRWL